MRRKKTIRTGAIVIVLALLLSLIAGAMSITPSQAAEDTPPPIPALTSVAPIDTDSDGIVNNEDPDIDNDGLANFEDNDIDGDGQSNFDDGDPAATNGFDGNTPNLPDSLKLQELAENGTFWWLGFGLVAFTGVAVLIIRKSLKRRGQNRQKNL